MSKQVVLSIRLCDTPLDAVRHLDLSVRLEEQLVVRGGALIAWGADRVSFSFGDDGVDAALSAAAFVLTEVGEHAVGLAYRELLTSRTSGAERAWGLGLVLAEALANAARPGELLADSEIGAIHTAIHPTGEPSELKRLGATKVRLGDVVLRAALLTPSDEARPSDTHLEQDDLPEVPLSAMTDTEAAEEEKPAPSRSSAHVSAVPRLAPRRPVRPPPFSRSRPPDHPPPRGASLRVAAQHAPIAGPPLVSLSASAPPKPVPPPKPSVSSGGAPEAAEGPPDIGSARQEDVGVAFSKPSPAANSPTTEVAANPSTATGAGTAPENLPAKTTLSTPPVKPKTQASEPPAPRPTAEFDAPIPAPPRLPGTDPRLSAAHRDDAVVKELTRSPSKVERPSVIDALRSGNPESMLELADQLKTEAGQESLARRLEAMAQLAKGEVGHGLDALREAAKSAKLRDSKNQSRAALALAVGLAMAGKKQEALLQGLEALSRARAREDRKGELACRSFISQLARSAGHAEVADTWLQLGTASR